MRDLDELAKWRVESGDDGGSFRFQHHGPDHGGCRVAMGSAGITSRYRFAHRCPTWDEMEWVKRKFFRDDETAMQLHVPASDHISFHPYTLHIWRPQDADIPRPPAIFVAPLLRRGRSMSLKVNRDKIDWDEALVERLKILWDEGVPASQIAEMIGQGATKNSIIGKAHRLQAADAPPVAGQPSAGHPSAGRAAADQAAEAPPIARQGTASASEAAACGDGASHHRHHRHRRPDLSRALTQGTYTLLDLGPHECRWPVNAPPRGSAAYLFCGEAPTFERPPLLRISQQAWLPEGQRPAKAGGRGLGAPAGGGRMSAPAIMPLYVGDYPRRYRAPDYAGAWRIPASHHALLAAWRTAQRRRAVGSHCPCSDVLANG